VTAATDDESEKDRRHSEQMRQLQAQRREERKQKTLTGDQASISGGLQSAARSRVLRQLLWFVMLSLAAATGRADAPQRLVSLNLCLDHVLMAIAPRERIIAISHYSSDPQRSTRAALARTFPVTYETAEEVVLLRPDFVLASRHSALATREALRRLGVRVKTYDVPDSIEGSLAQILEIADDIGRPNEGAALVAQIRSGMDAARQRAAGETITAAIYQPGGMTAGPATLPGELMRIAGFDNIAGARYGVYGWRPLSLELLVSNPPQVLLAGESTEAAFSRAQRILTHRVLLRLDTRMTRVFYPAQLLYCAGPAILDALEALDRARGLYRTARQRS
jgi:iron complex transport system substrate-binding protein